MRDEDYNCFIYVFAGMALGIVLTTMSISWMM